MVDRTASRPQRSWRTSSAHARRCSTSSTARARTLPTRPPTPPTLTTSRTSVRSCRPHPPTRKQQCCHHLSRPCAVPRVDSLPAGVGARPRGRERRARGRARTAQRRDQHARVAAHRAGQRARAPRPRGGHGCLRFNSLPHQPFWFSPALSLSLSLSLMCVHAWRWKQAQRGLHELYATVADINAQEEGLPPAAKAREPAPSTKVPVKRPRESSASASPAPAPAPVPAPAVSPAVQAPLQQRAPVAPTPAPDLHIDDDSSFSTQFVVVSLCLSLFLCVHRCALSQRKTCCSRVLDGTVGAESHVRNLCIVVLHAMTMCVPITHTFTHRCTRVLSSSLPPSISKTQCKCTIASFLSRGSENERLTAQCPFLSFLCIDTSATRAMTHGTAAFSLWGTPDSGSSTSLSSSASSSDAEEGSNRSFYAQTLAFSGGLLAALLICIIVRSSKKLHVCSPSFTDARTR